jgi:hypothetical protein
MAMHLITIIRKLRLAVGTIEEILVAIEKKLGGKNQTQTSFLDKYPHVRFVIEQDRQEIKRAQHYEKMRRAKDEPVNTPGFLQGKIANRSGSKGPILTIVPRADSSQ